MPMRKNAVFLSLDRWKVATASAKSKNDEVVDDAGGVDDGNDDSGDETKQTNGEKKKDGEDVIISKDTLIKAQIIKAKQQLDNIPKNHPCNAAFPVIEAALAKGRVKPLFHALVLPETFLNNRLSSSVVTAGKMDTRKTTVIDVDADNLDEFVDVSKGTGANSIIDVGVNAPWEFSRKQTTFAVDLVNAEAVMLGSDIESTNLTSMPAKVNPKDKLYDLLTRPESRGVVSDVFHRFAAEADDGGSVAAMTGSPGIGKSWTLLYALQQALLYDGATVLFFFQKDVIAVMYQRRNNVIYAWKKKVEFADSILFQRPDVLVLLDPREAKQGGALFALGQMKLLYAASNNEAHFKSAAEKNNGRMRAFLGPPLDREMQGILKRLDPQLTQDVIDERQKNVGNLIRYILDAQKYKERIYITNETVRLCAKDPEKLEDALLAEGMSNGEDTIPGTLFQLLPKRPNPPTEMGYDGQNVNYREWVVQAASDNVRKAVLTVGRGAVRRGSNESQWYGDEKIPSNHKKR